MRAQSPNETRSIEAAFVHSGLDTGPVVQGAVRVEGELVLKRFVARNVKPIIPIVWNQVIGDQLFPRLKVDKCPGSYHSVGLAKALRFVKAVLVLAKRSLQQSHFRGRKH